jgi:hypothetical protein
MATAVEAFNATRRTALAQQAEARQQEEAAINNAIKRETMPYLAKTAQLELQRLQADIGYRTALAERQRAEATALNEERFGALDAESLAQEITGSLGSFRRSATSDSSPVAYDLNELPAAPDEPRQSFDLDAGAPIRLNSTSASSDNVLMNTFGKAAANPLDEFAPSRAQVLGPGDTLAPIGSGGDVIESDQTYSTEDRNKVMESAAKTLQTRGGTLQTRDEKSTNPLVTFNAPEPEPDAAPSPSQSSSPLSALFDDYQQASALLKSRVSSATERRDIGRIKGATALVDQQFLSTAASEFGMGPIEFEALRKMDPVLRTRVEEYHRNSGGREGWAGSIDYVTAMSAERAKLKAQQEAGLLKPDAEDPSKRFEYISKQVEALRSQAETARASNQFTRASLFEDEANRRMLEVSDAPQISDEQVALAAYRNTKSPDEKVRTDADAEFKSLLPSLQQRGYVISLDGLSDEASDQTLRAVQKKMPGVYTEMFVQMGDSIRPMTEVLAEKSPTQPAVETAKREETEQLNPNNPFRGGEGSKYFNKEDQAALNKAAQVRSLTRQLEGYKRQRDSVKSDPFSSPAGKERDWDKYDRAIKVIEKKLNDLR